MRFSPRIDFDKSSKSKVKSPSCDRHSNRSNDLFIRRYFRNSQDRVPNHGRAKDGYTLIVEFVNARSLIFA